MVTIADCLKLAAELQMVSDTPRLDVEVMLARLLDVGRSWLYTWPEQQLTDQQLVLFQAFFQRRKQGEPIAHIVGEREFWSLSLKVNKATLIPRPDTETLVEKALQLQLPEDACVLDLGTGTGAIALALASEKPTWSVVAVDRVPEAVSLARENADRLGLENVCVEPGSWFSGLSGRHFHLIASNPPYIPQGDPHLERGDVRFEPVSALISAEKGLADLRHIIHSAGDHLYAGGWLLLEHGFDQGRAVRAMLSAAGFADVETCEDLSGQERVSCGRWPGVTLL